MESLEAAVALNKLHEGTWAEEAGLVVTSATRDEVRATITVQPKHRQPYGIVHGGVYSSIVESMASVGSGLDAMTKGKRIVGLENNTSFVRAVREGTLHAIGTPITRGRRSQLWEVTIRNDENAVVATGRVRLLLLDPETPIAGGPLALP